MRTPVVLTPPNCTIQLAMIRSVSQPADQPSPGPGYRVTARGFDTTEAIASGGGVDIARIYGDESGNQWRHSDDQVQWTGADGQVRVARNFERVEAFEQLEQIELEALSNLSSLQPASIVPWLFEDTEDRNERDAAATRSVFEQLGNQ